MGHSHSQYTIVEEYLRPLLGVGLATETQDQYHATTFGGRLTEMIENSAETVNFLPAHSECYEEKLLKALLSGQKTWADMNELVSQKITSRILERLKTANLITTPERKKITYSSSDQNTTLPRKRSPGPRTRFTAAYPTREFPLRNSLEKQN